MLVAEEVPRAIFAAFISFRFLVAFALLFSGSALAQRYVQQGGVLQQGVAVSVSFDGNTAVVGDPNSSVNGGAYVLNRNGGVWAQVGPALTGTGATNPNHFNNQGSAVAVSADGNTILIGGPNVRDNTNLVTGASWVFTKVNETWVQQGGKLVGVGVPGGPIPIYQGYPVALSADGNTAVVGAAAHFQDKSYALMIAFTRSNGVWTQQGPPLLGSDEMPPPSCCGGGGGTVAISSDGNTAMLGASSDGGGGAWIFTRSNGVWTQQGGKLVGTGVSGESGAEQGFSVALSADGNTAVLGGPGDNNQNPKITNTGAVWVFTRSNGTWTQQGPKLTGGAPSDLIIFSLGRSVSISADGNTIVAGTFVVDTTKGGQVNDFWLFTRHDGVWGQAVYSPFPGTSASGNTSVAAAISGDSGTIILLDQIPSFQGEDAAVAYVAPVLKASITDSGNFFRGESGASFTLSVSNVGPLATPSQVTLAAVIHTGLTATGLAGNGWSCTLSTLKCTRTDPLAPGTAYPAVTLTVNVASDAPSSVVATVGAWGGYSNSSSTTDHVTVH